MNIFWQGEQLRASGGRLRKLEKQGQGTFSATWTAESGDRVTVRARLGRSYGRGIPQLWPFIAAGRSHLKAVQLAEKVLDPYVLLLEDDAVATVATNEC